MTTQHTPTHFVDSSAILDLTIGVPREQALRFREELIHLLRVLEDMHGLPRSVPTKSEQPHRDVESKSGHHNR